MAGREFSAVVAAAGIGETSERVEEWCDALVRRGQFLHANGTAQWPDGTITGSYRFHHALYPSVLYGRLPEGRRLRIHQRLGVRLEQGYGEQTRDLAGELAMHFERGQDFTRATHYLQQAAETALQRAAYQEAIDHLNKGLGLLHTLPDTSERMAYELTLQASLGVALSATKGYAAPETESVHVRARELFHRVGDNPQLLPTIFGVWVFHLMRAELKVAREIAEQSLLTAQHHQDPALLISAYVATGFTRFHLGEFAAAKEYLERGFALYDPVKYRSNIFTYGTDLGGACLNYGAWALWHLGYPERALHDSRQSVALSERLSHNFTSSFALDFAAGVYQFRREPSAARKVAEAELTTAHKQDFPFWVPQGTIYRGWALAEEGQIEEGVSQMQQGVEMLRAIQSELDLPHFLWLLAEGYKKQEKFEAGMNTLEEALLIVNKTGERYWEAELYRLKGEFLLRTMPLRVKGKGRKGREPVNGELQAEQCFQTALKIAQQQQAKSLELRAATSLGRLWQRQGKKQEAHALLAEIYAWFTEGFDTADLQEAKALLDGLR